MKITGRLATDFGVVDPFLVSIVILFIQFIVEVPAVGFFQLIKYKFANQKETGPSSSIYFQYYSYWIASSECCVLQQPLKILADLLLSTKFSMKLDFPRE